MSLGLNDLKKRAAKTQTGSGTASGSVSGAGAVSEKWTRGTKTARPWTNANLQKKPTRTAHVDGASMSAEWTDEHVGAFHAFNMETQSAFAMLKDLRVDLKEQAREIEQKIKRAAMGPFEIAKSVLRLMQK